MLQEQQQEELQQQVLGLLGQMAGSSAAAGWQVLQWLQPLMTAALSKGQKVSSWLSMSYLFRMCCLHHHCTQWT